MEGLLRPNSHGFTDPNVSYTYYRGDFGFSNPKGTSNDPSTSQSDDSEDSGGTET